MNPNRIQDTAMAAEPESTSIRNRTDKKLSAKQHSLGSIASLSSFVRNELRRETERERERETGKRNKWSRDLRNDFYTVQNLEWKTFDTSSQALVYKLKKNGELQEGFTSETLTVWPDELVKVRRKPDPLCL